MNSRSIIKGARLEGKMRECSGSAVAGTAKGNDLFPAGFREILHHARELEIDQSWAISESKRGEASQIGSLYMTKHEARLTNIQTYHFLSAELTTAFIDSHKGTPTESPCSSHRSSTIHLSYSKKDLSSRSV